MRLLSVLLLGTGLVAQSIYAQDSDAKEANPLDAFAMMPAMTSASVSPDGKRILIRRATTINGDYIIEIHDVNKLDAEPVRLGADRMELMGASWLNKDKIYVSFRQNIQDGTDNYWVNKGAIVNADGEGKWHVPFSKDRQAYYGIIDRLRDDPDHVLMSYDINDNYIPDVIKYNINTGRTNTIMRGNDEVSGGFVVDWDGEVRAGTGYDSATNSIHTYARLKGEEKWRLVHVNSPSDRSNFDFIDFNKENPDEIYVNANNGENTTGIYLYNIRTGEYSERLFGLKSVDAGGVLFGSKDHNLGKPLAFSYTKKWPTLYFLDAEAEALQRGVEQLFPDSYVRITSRSDDDNQMIIYTESDKEPGSWYLLSNKSKLQFLGERFPAIDKDKLGSLKFVTFKARDGLKVPAYVTIPSVGKKPWPTVVMPHGGPWARDYNIFDEWSQMLASHGYLVIQPQYRGSTGFGMELWKAGDAQWGLTMQDDLDDAAMYLVNKGLADKDRLGMFGWSFGGYTSFVASMREDNIYQCAVAAAGVASIDRWRALINRSRYGRIYQLPTVDGVSPVDHVNDVNIPLLVLHGDIDRQVTIEHSREFIDKIKSANKDYKYVEIEGADHYANTLFYPHRLELYEELLGWLDSRCQ